MSYKKSKLDLLVRVRYANPLPAPPCPPKLLDIPTDPLRYARPEFLDAIANETPLPMIVDAELGMPLDLSKWECLWEPDMDDSSLNPDPHNLPPIDPKDEFLLGDLTSAPTAYINSSLFTNSTPGPSTPTPNNAYVPWLRKTEYISRETRNNVNSDSKPVADNTVDVSRPAQIRDIESSFAAAAEAEIDLKNLKHPTKPGVTAVESFEILPDADIWANAYDLFRFSERPGDRPIDVPDPRLDCAVLRPVESDGDHFLAYYLTKDDEAAIAFKTKRQHGDINMISDELTAFHFVRDYEVMKVEQDVPNEFLLVLDDGEHLDGLYEGKPEHKPRRPKGAYYKNIERKMTLKKRRGNMDAYADKWDIVNVTHLPMTSEEAEERAEALAEVDDPLYLIGAIDAEGDIDESHANDTHTATIGFEGDKNPDVDVTGFA